MNKKLILLFFGIVAVGGGMYWYSTNNPKELGKAQPSPEAVVKQSEEPESRDKAKDEAVKDEAAKEVAHDENAKTEEPTPETDTKEPAGQEETKEAVNPISSEELNSSPVESKKSGKTIVLFRDGTRITDTDIKSELDELPEQISKKMSLAEIKSFLAWKNAYERIMTDVARKSGIGDQEKVKDLINKRKLTAAGLMLLDEEAKKLMTFTVLKKHYDDIWDKNFKGTKEFSLVAVTTSSKDFVEKAKATVKDQASLKKLLEINASVVKSMDMDSRPQGMFPEEISSAVLKQGENAFVGPFEVKGAFVFFYVKAIKDAKKKEFTEEFAEEYKKVAIKDFIKEYMKTLYAKYKVQIFDINNKVVDPFDIVGKGKKEADSKKSIEALARLKDTDVLAKFDGGVVLVKDLKEFYKVNSLVDETFVSMAKQFNLPLESVFVYALKLIADDKILSQVVTERNYLQNPLIQVKLANIERMELLHAYYKENVKVKSADVKATFNKFIKSIPEEDKNDNEISVKLAFFESQEEAAKALKSVQDGEEKFTTIYKNKLDHKESVDLGYIKKRGTPPELWSMLKAGASGTCCKQIVQIDGTQFGIPGKNYVLVYVADRRPVVLPSLANEPEKRYFQKLAEREQAVKLVKAQMIAAIKTIDGKNVEEVLSSEQADRMISVLLGYV